MPGDLNLKKSWHPGLQKNQAAVHAREQDALEERRRIQERQREIKLEREREELQKLQEMATGKKKVARVEWMYNDPTAAASANATTSTVDANTTDDYLLGKRRIDNVVKQKGHLEAFDDSLDRFQPKESTAEESVVHKVKDDPMAMVKERARELNIHYGDREGESDRRKRRRRREREDRERSRSRERRRRRRRDDSRERRRDRDDGERKSRRDSERSRRTRDRSRDSSRDRSADGERSRRTRDRSAERPRARSRDRDRSREKERSYRPRRDDTYDRDHHRHSRTSRDHRDIPRSSRVDDRPSRSSRDKSRSRDRQSQLDSGPDKPSHSRGESPPKSDRSVSDIASSRGYKGDNEDSSSSRPPAARMPRDKRDSYRPSNYYEDHDKARSVERKEKEHEESALPKGLQQMRAKLLASKKTAATDAKLSERLAKLKAMQDDAKALDEDREQRLATKKSAEEAVRLREELLRQRSAKIGRSEFAREEERKYMKE